MPRPTTPTRTFLIGGTANDVIAPGAQILAVDETQPASAAVAPIHIVPLRKSRRLVSMLSMFD